MIEASPRALIELLIMFLASIFSVYGYIVIVYIFYCKRT